MLDERGHGRVVGERGAVGCGGAGQGQSQAGVVGLGVPVQEGGGQAVCAQKGKVGQGLAGVDAPVPFADADASRDVIQPEGHRVRLGDALDHHAIPPEQRDEERQRVNQVRSIREQALPFVKGFIDQAVVTLL